MTSASKNKKGRFLPEQFDIAHDLCFVIHDVMLQIIKSGEEGKFFVTKINLLDGEEEELNNTDDIFSWLESTNRIEDRAKILVSRILPAVLSDSLHCTYEALENSRKAKLGVTYILIRKTLQESIYVLESMVLDKLHFAESMVNNPLRLRPKNAGGIEGHEKRINEVLSVIGENNRLDASYIANLRYNKKTDDSFDGICNHAMHLFTEHKSIRTDNLNINFIFSGEEQKFSQWSYFYSRFPYLLFYMHQMVEYIVSAIAPTSQDYLDDINRRISALIMLWWENTDEHYRCPPLKNFYEETEKWLNFHCIENGYHAPKGKDLKRMSERGALPGESLMSVKKRNMKFSLHAAYNNIKAGK